MPICELRGVCKDYGQGVAAVRALSDIDLVIEAGEFTVFSGPSGSGKTTLLNLIGCLDQATSGKVLLEGKDTHGLSPNELSALRASRIGFIFQSFNLIPVLTALENVELALQLSRTHLTDRRARATRALTEVGLGDFLHRRPNQLSGGQQQRVAIARALVKEPALVIADEPTANLDSNTGAQVLELMRTMNEKSAVTFLFSTHDPMVMARAKRVVVLKDGKLFRDELRDGQAAQVEAH
jgi:putative ABC transport system ATP-binding protein